MCVCVCVHMGGGFSAHGGDMRLSCACIMALLSVRRCICLMCLMCDMVYP